MELEFIYTNKDWQQLGYLNDCKLDIEIGKYNVASNDFELTINKKNWNREFDKGSLFYAENTEYGGMVLSKKVDTSSQSVILKGKTFRGLLEKEYIQPSEGETHVALKGEVNEAIKKLLGTRFNDLITVDELGLSNIHVDYQVRDMNLLDALERMLTKKNARIDIKYFDNQCHIKAVEVKDLSEQIQIDYSYRLTMVVEEPAQNFNHVLALGKGELTQRLRLNLYKQPDGSWGTAENGSGLSRHTFKYEDTNEEVLEKLKEKAIEKVNEANGSNTVSVSFDGDMAELFDIVSAKEEITGVSFKERITRKILKAEIGKITKIELEHKVGDNK